MDVRPKSGDLRAVYPIPGIETLVIPKTKHVAGVILDAEEGIALLKYTFGLLCKQ